MESARKGLWRSISPSILQYYCGSGRMWSRRLHSPSPHSCQKWVRRLAVRSTRSRLCQEERGQDPSPAVWMSTSSRSTTPTSPSEAIQTGSGLLRHPTQFLVFDTAKGAKCPLTTGRPNILTWYSCGPTVYDSAHIGHASSFIRQDVIRRLLQHYHKDLTVVQVMGITDIDDKIILKARQTDQEWRSVSRHYEREFKEDLSRLGVSPPHLFTNVSDFIPQILEFVGKLVSSGYAYPVEDGSVYFDTQKYGDKYGIFGQTQEDAEDLGSDTGGKKAPRDFAVWKGAKPDEPYWDSPWGSGRKGRPGWHIECSVMASQIFGPSLDLHTGGKDLIFPHHENEEAQCCAHFQSPQWTNHWLHMGHLHFKGDVKMSKSLGNTISIRQFLEQHSPQLLRLICLISRYRKDLEYSQDNIELAQTILNKLHTFSGDTRAILSGQKTVSMSPDMDDGGLWEKLEHSKVQLNSALLNDFGTSEGIKIVTELISDFNRHFDSGGVGLGAGGTASNMASFELVIATRTFVQNFIDLVGLSQTEQLARTTTDGSSPVEVEPVLDKFVAFRNSVRSYSLAMDEPDKGKRKEKMSQRKELIQVCDGVRKELLEEYNVEIKDYGSKSSWSITEKK